MKLHLPTGLRKAIATLFAAIAVGTLGTASLHATELTDAKLQLSDFSATSISTAEAAGWVFTNVTAGEDGVFYSTSSQGVLHTDTDWATQGGGSNNRALWSAIVQVNGDSLLKAGTSGTIFQSQLTTPTEGAAFSDGKLVGAWNNAPWTGLTIGDKTLAQCVDGAGSITIGIQYLGDNGTAIYIVDGQKKVYSASAPGLKGGGNPPNLHMDLLFTSTAGIGYESLYLFGNTVDATSMTAMLQSLATEAKSDVFTWNGQGTSAAWDTVTQNWLSNGSPATYQSKILSNAVFGTTAPAKRVTVDTEIIAGAVEVQDAYTFVVSSSLSIDALSTTGTGSATMTGDGDITISSIAAGSNLIIGENTRVNTGNISVTAAAGTLASGKGTLVVNKFSVSGGSVAVASGLEINGGGDGTGSANRSAGFNVTNAAATVDLLGNTYLSGAMYVQVGTVNIGNGTDAVRVSTNRVEFGDTSGAGTSTLNVNKNAILQVRAGDVANSYSSTGILMGEWGGVSEANIYGKLYADQASAYVGDNTATFNIQEGGLMAVQGFSQNQHKGDKTETINLNLLDGGTVVLGANGIDSQKPINVSLGAGEVGISATDVEIAKDVTLTSTGTKFNTSMYEWQGSGESLELTPGTTEGSLTVSGSISGDGSLIKDGAGMVTLTAENFYTGGTTVTGGTLKATVDGALGNGTVTVQTDGVLDLAVGNVLDSFQSVANSGNVILHETLTTGTITGGTVTVEISGASGLKDVGGDTTTGNGFYQGGNITVCNPANASVDVTTMMYNGTNQIDKYDKATGVLSLGGDPDWTTYQINKVNTSQPTVQAIVDYAKTNGGTLKAITVAVNGVDLINDCTGSELSTSMISGSGVAEMGLQMLNGSKLTVDGDFAGSVNQWGSEDAEVTLDVTADSRIGYLGGYNDGGFSTIKVTGTSGKVLTLDEAGFMASGLQIENGVVVDASGSDEVLFLDSTGGKVTVKGASLLKAANVEVASVDGSADAVVTYTGGEPLGEAYAIGNNGFTVADAKLTVNSESAVTVANKRTGKGSLINEGAGKVTDNDGDFVSYTALEANGGNIELTNKASGVSAVDLKVADGKSVTSTQPLTVSGSATFGAGSSVVSNFVMLSGSTLEGDAATPVTLGSHSLNLSSSITLGTNLMNAVNNLVTITDSVGLFNGVSNLTLNGSSYATEAEVDAATVFGGLATGKYLLTFGSNLVSIKKAAVTALYWGKDKRDGNWDTLEGNTVWAQADGLDGSVAFTNGMDAFFTANGGGGTITVNEAIEAASITVTGNQAYTFDKGAGSLTVTGPVTVESGSTATFNLGLSGATTTLVANGTMNLNEDSNVKSVNVGGSGMINLADTKTLTSAQAMTLAGGAKLNGKGTYNATNGVTVSDGTATVAGGTLKTTTVAGAGKLAVDGGSLDIASGSTTTVSSTLDLKGSTSLSNKGTLAVTNSGRVIAGNGVSLGTVDAKGTIELNGASVSATGGSIAALDMGSGETLTVDNDLALTTTTGSAGTLSVTGGLTVNGAAALTDVKAGSLTLEATAGALTVTGTLDAGSITLDRVSKTEHYLTAGGLSEGTTNFWVDEAQIAAFELSAGQIITLADLNSDHAGAANLTVNDAKYITDTRDLAYYISQDSVTKDIILTVRNQESDYVWTGAVNEHWNVDGNWSGGKVPDETSWVQFNGGMQSILLDGDTTTRRLTVSAGTDDTLCGDYALVLTQSLEVDANGCLHVGNGSTETMVSAPSVQIAGELNVQENAFVDSEQIAIKGGVLSVEDGGSAFTGQIDMTEGGSLYTYGEASVATGQLNGDPDSTVGGNVTVYGNGGRYTGGYDDAHIEVIEDADATFYAGEGLNLHGDGTVKLQYSGDTAIGGVDAGDLDIILNDPTSSNIGSTLTLQNPSAMEAGSITFGMSAIDSASTINTNRIPVIIDATDFAVGNETTVVVNQDKTQDTGIAMAVGNNGKTRNLVLARVGADNTNTDSVVLNGNLYGKYFKNARIEHGALLVDMNDTYYQTISGATSFNGRAGAGMLDDAFVENNPQISNPTGDLAAVMTALEQGAISSQEADRVLSAMSGASHAAMGAAWSRDVDRQLRAIRNRTTSMGVAECVVNEDMPFINVWINAEGDYTKLNNDGTLAGYKLSSWGGTVGVDVDFTNRFTMGLAVTAMSGDFTACSADNAEGDLDRLYVSVFGRYTHRAWTHTLVGTFGMADTDLKRTVDYGVGSYTTNSSSDGTAFGLMYEVGYTVALNENATTCLQPVLNLSYRHSSLDGCSETGTDAALRGDDVDMDVFTIALGARLQSVVGTSVYNRSSIFEGRVLCKLDAGDREASTHNSFVNVGNKREVRSSEMGAFGLELGAGLVVPIAEDGGSIFFDVSAEIRDKYTEVNGTVGYRYNF